LVSECLNSTHRCPRRLLEPASHVVGLWLRPSPEAFHIASLLEARKAGGKAPFTPKGVVHVLRIFRETFNYAGLLDERRSDQIESLLITASDQPGSSFDDSKITTISLFRPSTALPLTESFEGWTEEPLTDEAGDLILIRYRGKPHWKRYEFIRDYLDLKIKRLKRDS